MLHNPESPAPAICRICGSGGWVIDDRSGTAEKIKFGEPGLRSMTAVGEDVVEI